MLARTERPEGISTSRACELLGVNRASVYYKTTKTEKSTEKAKPVSKKKRVVSPRSVGIMTDIDITGLNEKEARMRIIYTMHEVLPTSGARKMARMCSACGLSTTRYRAGALMGEMRIHTIYPKPNLSAPAKHSKKFPYLLKNKRIWCPNQVWSIDITYIPTRHGHMYLTAIIDWYSRLIVGWNLADTLEVSHVKTCVETAIKDYGVPGIINSDMGSQFTSNEYIELLARHGIVQSMDGRDRWVDNVVIERWFRTCKSECIRINDFVSPRELRAGIRQFVGVYNDVRLHASLDYITPRMCYESAFRAVA